MQKIENQKEAKRSKAKKRLYFLLCFSPLISFAIIRPDWLARLIAVAGCVVAFNFLIFWYGFNPKTNFIWKYSKWAKQTERTQQFGQKLFRTLTILFGCFIFWFVTKPVATDCIQIAKKGEKGLITFEGQITSDESQLGMYFFRQSLWVSEDNQPRGIAYEAFFFPSYLGQKNQLHQFLTTPESHLILECNSVAKASDNSLFSNLISSPK